MPVPDYSLLAREINWMETGICRHILYSFYKPNSLLAREINWMETRPDNKEYDRLFQTLYSLEKLIEWKLIR